MKQQTYSMRYRAMIIIVVVMIVFFTSAGWALYNAFEKSVDESAKSTMEAYIVSLLSTMDFINDGGSNETGKGLYEEGRVARIVFDTLPLPQLSQANSGIYAEVWGEDSLLWRSDSLIGRSLPRMPVVMSEYQFYANEPTLMGVGNVLTLGVDWQEEEGVSKKFDVTVVVDALPYQKRLDGFSTSLFTWLFLIGVALLLLQIVFFSFLFRPLSRVVGQLSQIESGERVNFDREYPKEVLVLTSSLNAYIEHEKTQITKQKASLANLAHALKTPLAVIRGSLAQQPIDKIVAEEQLDAMSGSIEYQLNKATSLSRQRYLKPINCAPLIQSVVSALTKLYAEKGVEILVDLQEGVEFFGDEGDFLELVGNILENACKWCDKRVFLILRNVALEEVHRKRLECHVLDDGSGVELDKRELIVQRGKRLDEQVKGHGIGLSIVNDIVESYGGKLDFGDAKGQLNVNEQSYTLTSGLKVKLVV